MTPEETQQSQPTYTHSLKLESTQILIKWNGFQELEYGFNYEI